MKVHTDGGFYNMADTNLHILDTSNYLYAGSYYNKKYISRGVRESNGDYCANKAPIGGVAFLISSIRNILINDPNAVIMPVFDRTPEIKREAYASFIGDPFGYKGKRGSKPPALIQQKDYAEQILNDMGFVVQAVDQYEADDVIYSLVRYYIDDFDHIYIHTKDSDLTFLVSPKVSIAPVTKGDKRIDIHNYRSMANSKRDTMYNTVHLRKLCEGDTSDNIPGVGWEWAEYLDNIIPNEDYEKLGDLELCRKYIKEAIYAHPTANRAQSVLQIFNLMMPYKVPYDLLNDMEQDIDREKLCYYVNWDPSLDRWGLEDMLCDYIDSTFE